MWQKRAFHICRVPPALSFPLESIPHFIHAQPYSTCRNLPLSSLSATSRTPLSLSVYSAQWPLTSSENQALLLAQLLTSSKKCLWILYSSPFLLSPCGEVGIREWVLSPDASLGKDAAAGSHRVPVQSMQYVPSSTLWSHWERDSPAANLTLAFLALSLWVLRGPAELGQKPYTLNLKFHTGGALTSLLVLQIAA